MLQAILLIGFFAWAIYFLVTSLKSAITYDLDWFKLPIKIKVRMGLSVCVALGIVSYALSFFLPLALIVVCISTVPAYFLWTRRKFNWAVRQLLEKDLKDKKELLAKLQFVEKFLGDLPPMYYKEDKERYFAHLYNEHNHNLLYDFCKVWDDVQRLHHISIVTRKKCVSCLQDLDYLDKQARGDLAWKRTQEETSRKQYEQQLSQREAQLKANAEKKERNKKQHDEQLQMRAERKASQLGLTSVEEAVQLLLVEKEKMKQEKRERAEKAKKDQEEEHQKELRTSASSAKAAYKNHS